MILIIDSGGTKLEWRFINSDGAVLQGKTTGFHPLFQEASELDAIFATIKSELPEVPVTIHYYGAGCIFPDQVAIIRKSVSGAFPNVSAHFESDLLAAARALCGHNEGIACILGTGSNSCYYDGLRIRADIPPLGYILGDEGSGVALGKRLIKAYCRKELSEPLQDAFFKRYKLRYSDIINKVYNDDSPNKFLAGFAKFLFDHQNDPVIYDLIKSAFIDFMEVLSGYDMIDRLPVHFTGSVAFYFNSILRQVLKDVGMTPGHIVEGPIAGLVLYHQQEIK